MATARENKLAILALTKGGAALGKRLKKSFPHSHLYLPERLKDEESEESFYFTNWKDTVKKIFEIYQGIIFIMATGIVVRAIAPHLKDKKEDPAVVVVDERGRFPISLLSGHVGGANELCIEVANFLEVEPVITTATDVNEKPAVDMLAKKLNCKAVPPEKVKLFNRLLAEGEAVELYTMWPEAFAGEGFVLRSWEELGQKLNTRGAVIITNRKITPPSGEHIFLYPRNLVVGVGCRRDVPEEDIMAAISIVFDEYQLNMESIKLLASIDLKAKERGIISVAQKLGIPFKTIPIEKISRLEGTFQESHFVKKITGVGGVCEPAARILSRGGKLVVPKQKIGKVTVAVAEEKFML
ncbi:MAG: cobalt-precorrin hydrolase [Clostridia bacterium]|nr:cobalamin [Clostridiales bacterium]MDK2984858.1 cobalt-precorrin hydrolase [Clostridia bacterium]